jgi:osmotically-inducible protein OsmY
MATTGAQAVYNRHTIQKNVNDQMITMKAYHILNYKNDELFKNAHISIATFNNDVLLAGEAPEIWQRKKAEVLVQKIPGVKNVYNFISQESPSSTLTRMSDGWITTKVKGQLIASSDIDTTEIKVVTENGNVYLMGVLEPSTAKVAEEIARSTSGVKRVVRIFSYVHISKAVADA